MNCMLIVRKQHRYYPYLRGEGWGVLFVLLWVLLGGPVTAQFPKECTNTQALTDKKCCPVNGLTGAVCGGPGRGTCQTTVDYDVEEHCVDCGLNMASGDDERLYWPMAFFTDWCECEWPFAGASCSECAWGYYGSECDEKKTIVRQNLLKIEDRGELEKTLLYLNWMKSNISEDYVVATCTREVMMDLGDNAEPCYVELSMYDYIVWVHWYAAADFNSELINDYNHISSGLPTWHRHFMLQWERALQEISGDYDYAIPYYKWTGEDNCSICTDDMFGGSDVNGLLSNSRYFSDWETLCVGTIYISEGLLCDPYDSAGLIIRNPGRDTDVSTLPSDAKFRNMLNWSTFDTDPYDSLASGSFRNILSGKADPLTGELISGVDVHLAGHYYMNGTMTPRTSSPNDPLFSVFHSFVDLFFELWIQKWGAYGIGTYPVSGAYVGHNRYDYLVGIFPPRIHDNYLGISENYGYTYEPL